MSDLIPKPEAIRERLEAIERERTDLRRLLRLAEQHHGGKPAEQPTALKLETKGG